MHVAEARFGSCKRTCHRRINLTNMLRVASTVFISLSESEHERSIVACSVIPFSLSTCSLSCSLHLSLSLSAFSCFHCCENCCPKVADCASLAMSSPTASAVSEPSPANMKRLFSNQSLNVEQMLAVLQEQGWVESNSGKHRCRLHHQLTLRGLKWKEEIVATTNGRGLDLCEWSRGGRRNSRNRLHSTRHTIDMYARWIKSGRIVIDEVADACTFHEFCLIAHAWDPSLTRSQVADILVSASWSWTICEGEKYHPFNTIHLRKPIKRITLLK
jgi:hypothetical protein